MWSTCLHPINCEISLPMPMRKTLLKWTCLRRGYSGIINLGCILSGDGCSSHSVPCKHVQICTNVLLLFFCFGRSEKALTSFETQNGIRARWQEHDPYFTNAKQRLMSKKRSHDLLKLHKTASERTFLLELRAKYLSLSFPSDGQAIAIKLAKQIDKVVTSINQGLVTLNKTTAGETLTFDDVKDPCSEIYSMCALPCSTSAVPGSFKSKLVQLLSLKDRCEEEEVMVKKEMLRLATIYSGQLEKISSFLGNTGSIDRGLRSLFLQKMDLNQRHFHLLRKVWGEAITFPDIGTCEDTPPYITEHVSHDHDDVASLFYLSFLDDDVDGNASVRGRSDDDMVWRTSQRLLSLLWVQSEMNHY